MLGCNVAVLKAVLMIGKCLEPLKHYTCCIFSSDTEISGEAFHFIIKCHTKGLQLPQYMLFMRYFVLSPETPLHFNLNHTHRPARIHADVGSDTITLFRLRQ